MLPIEAPKTLLLLPAADAGLRLLNICVRFIIFHFLYTLGLADGLTDGLILGETDGLIDGLRLGLADGDRKSVV